MFTGLLASRFFLSCFYFSEASVPTIEIEPTAIVPPKHGSDVKLVCKASTVISAYVHSVETKWNFQNLSEVQRLPKNAFNSSSGNRTHAVSELLLSKVSSKNVGKYYCSALLHVTKPEPETSMVDTYFQSVKIDKGNSMFCIVNASRQIPDKEKKLTQIFIFTLLCGATKDFMKALKAFIKPFEVSQRSVKIKI